jgi:hypothetical protein
MRRRMRIPYRPLTFSEKWLPKAFDIMFIYVLAAVSATFAVKAAEMVIGVVCLGPVIVFISGTTIENVNWPSNPLLATIDEVQGKMSGVISIG